MNERSIQFGDYVLHDGFWCGGIWLVEKSMRKVPGFGDAYQWDILSHVSVRIPQDKEDIEKAAPFIASALADLSAGLNGKS